MISDFLIIRLSSLGDIIHTLPAFAALRKRFPESTIRWVVERPGKEMLDFVPGIDETIVRGEKGWLKRLRARPQTALDFQGLVKSGLIARLSGAKRRVGFGRPNLKESAAALFYTEKLEGFEESGHVIAKNLRLLRRLGIQEDAFEFPLAIPGTLRNSVRSLLLTMGFQEGQKLVLCNVGAAWPTKRWPASHWARMIRLVQREGLFFLLLWGNETEKDLAHAVHQETNAPMAPFFSVKEVLALVKLADLLVSGDTFALQAACALAIPVVGIFGPTSPRRNGPFNERDAVACLDLDCNPCYKRTCSKKPCLSDISPEEVAGLAAGFLA